MTRIVIESNRFPYPPAKCIVCGKSLSQYNSSDVCFACQENGINGRQRKKAKEVMEVKDAEMDLHEHGGVLLC